MNFLEAIQSGFRNYVNFSSRAPRSEYWFWSLFAFVVSVITAIIDGLLLPGSQYGLLNPLAGLLMLLPSIAVTIRRLHDLDRTGWWFLLLFVPLVGWIVLLIWFCTRGTAGQNRFGPDSLAGM